MLYKGSAGGSVKWKHCRSAEGEIAVMLGVMRQVAAGEMASAACAAWLAGMRENLRRLHAHWRVAARWRPRWNIAG